MKTRYLFLILLFPAIAVSGELKPFTTDGCSSFPDGTMAQQSLWLSCCINHDLAYWKGGTYNDKVKADEALQSCVASIGEPEIAQIMLAGVRVGGSPYFPTPYRWGYGWPYLRGYTELTAEERKEVKQKLELLKLMINSLSDELDGNTK